MAQPFPSPEADLDRLRKFLEAGADVSLEVIQTFPGAEPSVASVERPGSVLFDVTPERLLQQIGDDQDQRVLLAIEIGKLERNDDFFLQLFVGNPDVSTETTTEDPSFNQGFSIFCDLGREAKALACPIGDLTIRTELDVTGTLRQSASPSNAVIASLIVVPLTDETPRDRNATITNAELSLVRSIVKLPS